MQPINPISFQANLMRQTKIVTDNKPPYKKSIVESTKKDLLASYDREIAKIEAYKQFAMRLDYMMYNDKDIQKKVKDLPDNIEIEVAAQLSTKENNGYEIELDSPLLIAENEDGKSAVTSIEYDNEGPDKAKILNWLDKLEETMVL